MSTQPAGAPVADRTFPGSTARVAVGADPRRLAAGRGDDAKVSAAVGRVPGPDQRRRGREHAAYLRRLDARRWPGLGRCGAPRADRGLQGVAGQQAAPAGRDDLARDASAAAAHGALVLRADHRVGLARRLGTQPGDQRGHSRKPDPLPKFLESRRRRDCRRCSAPRTSAPSTTSGVRSCRHRKLHPAAEPRSFRSVSQSSSPFGRRRCAVNLRPAYLGATNHERGPIARARLNRRLSRDSCCRPELRPVAIGGSAGRPCSPGRPRWMR